MSQNEPYNSPPLVLNNSYKSLHESASYDMIANKNNF